MADTKRANSALPGAGGSDRSNRRRVPVLYLATW